MFNEDSTFTILTVLGTCLLGFILVQLLYRMIKAKPQHVDVIWTGKYWLADGKTKLSVICDACGLEIPDKDRSISIQQLLTQKLGRGAMSGDQIDCYEVTFLAVMDRAAKTHIYPTEDLRTASASPQLFKSYF